MKVCYADEMRSVDSRATEKYGIAGIVLMENAAISCLKYLKEFDRITVVCGKGNNAGDGFCIARHLVNMGKDVKVYLALGDDFKGDALVNYNILKKMNVPVFSCDSETFEADLATYDCVCDAIFGTGLKGGVKAPVKEIIEKINELAAFVLSVDVPSGIDADTGAVETVAVFSDKTVTFAAYKAGLLLYPAADYAGDIVVTDISIPRELLDDIKINTLDEDEIYRIMPKRQKNSHKGDYGKIYIIGGCKGMAGAVALASKGAFRVGAGLVTACVPHEINDIIQCTAPEATVFSADFETEQDKITEKMKGYDAILFGCGIGRADYIQDLLEKVLENADCPVVIDADGLYALAKRLDLLEKYGEKVILTPHSMEFARLLSTDVETVEARRIHLSCDFAKKYDLTLVLKGNHTIISTPELQFINLTGNSGMATAGSGDVLAGMTAGFCPRCEKISDAAKLSVYLHGLAGDYKRNELGENSLMASDILDGIPHIFPVEK